MATIREIRRRIRSVRNTAKITKAMELVAASKMRRAQLRALAGRPYAQRITWVLADLAETLPLMDPETVHPLLQRREVRAAGIVLVTPTRGLCGGLPGNVNRRASALLLDLGAPAKLVAVGRKGRDFFRRANVPIVAEFTELGDYPEYLDVLPIARVIIDDYLAGEFDQVFLVYPFFVNTMVQEPRVSQLLPVEPPEEAATRAVDYIYEPGREAVLAELLPRYIEMQIYEAILEGIASEQSARMVAMRNATDAANEMIQELTLTYNKARQEQITKELLDIVGGGEGLKA
ncbi:MAG: ATP synthase F1 subunit gamma [Chloroflexi bacterium RBG_16_68_14]|nr:MAG: ATP synthase F1 subunit gamma [Chloroflexi bacterium RBG_16_68_14]